MKKFNYQGAVIKDNNKISSVAYVQCACGCLASRECQVIQLSTNARYVNEYTY